MQMKPTLAMRVAQQLTMTPQLQQSIKLLTLSGLQLEQTIAELLETNVMVDAESDTESDAEAQETSLDAQVDNDWDISATLGWSSSTAAADGSDLSDLPRAEAPGLTEILLEQIAGQAMPAAQRELVEILVYALDERGYLVDAPADLAPQADAETLDAAVVVLQGLEPAGVGARSMTECFALQLAELEGPEAGLAERLLALDIDDCADWAAIAARLDVGIAELHAALGLLRGLDPAPGRRFGSDHDDYIVPDLYAVCDAEGRWQVRLNPALNPQLRINGHYEQLLRTAAGAGATELKAQCQEARWFMRSLEMRNDTLLAVGNALVERQTAFLTRGEAALEPLVLREVADMIGMHESTVSRVTTRKYMATPRGLIELKSFFSIGVGNGAGCAAGAIKARIRDLVAVEPAERPLSDTAIVDRLAKDGIDVARRTVAKYREALGIPAVSKRRRQAAWRMPAGMDQAAHA